VPRVALTAAADLDGGFRSTAKATLSSIVIARPRANAASNALSPIP
jgi:hypothetical protein